MPGPFATRGATPINAKQDMKYVPIFIGKFFTGLYTNRNPLNEGAVTDIYSKFYQANRNDSIIDGLNTELSPRMTLIRRYGSSPYNSNTFNPINSFQNFFPFQTGVGESIIVIADTQADVRNVSNGQNSLLYAKNLGSTTNTSIQVAGSGVNGGGAFGTVLWTSPNNITSSSSYASVGLTNSGTPQLPVNQPLLAENFSFSVSGTLVNIQLNFQYYYSVSGFFGTPNGSVQIQLLRAGVPFGAPQTLILPNGTSGSTSSSPITASLSFPVLGLTSSDVNNAAFGFSITTLAIFRGSINMNVRFGQLSVSYQNVVSLPGGKMRSQQQLNTLYMVDGVNAKQWVWFPSWQANFAYTQLQSSPDPDNTILDSNNNIEVSVGYSIAIVSTAASSGTLTVNYTGSAIVTIGDSWTFIGLGNATGLNFITVTVLSTGAGSFTAATNLSDYTTLAETNGLAFKKGTAGATGTTAPTFGTTIGSTTLDNTVGWINKGSAVEPMGIAGPQVAPTTSLTAYTPVNPNTGLVYDSWAANTFYWRSLPVIVQTGNIWQLTQAGTTQSSVPGFGGGVGTVQNDGTAQWTNQGSATRVVSTPYALNRAIQVDTSHTVVTPKLGTKTYYNSSLMVTTTAGTTSATPTAAISWNTAYGATNQDGSVVWTVVSTVVQNSSYSNPILDRATTTSTSAVGNNQLVSLVTQIDDLDSGGGGYLQSIIIRWGVSGSSAPTWIDSIGSSTPDSTVTWICGGPVSATNTGAWSYAFSYINSVTGDESTASPLSLPILLTSGNQVIIEGPTTTQQGVDAIGIYRTTQGPSISTTGGTPFFLAEIPMGSLGSWQYLDASPDPGNTGSILNVEITASGYVFSGGLATNVNDPPPVGLTNLTAHCGRVWGFVGNILYFSTGPDVTVGNGGAAWDVLNFYEFPGTGHRAISTNFNGSTLFIFTSAGMYSIPGQGTISNPFGQQQSVAPNISVLSYDAFTQDGSTIYVYTADRNLLSMDVNAGFSDVGEPIADLLNSIDPGEAQLAFYVNNNDRALYISDFQTGWYRLAAVAAPETGFLWAPKAELVGGISGIGSVTTAPGINSLLIGPQVSGPILQRDRSVFSDNGSVYDSWATIGNLVLAHPGTMASIRFIALEAIKVGDCPTIGLLLDEFLGYPTTPAYTNLDQPSNDPPKLNASNTLYSVRYWLQQQGEPFWCKSALIRFNLGQSDTASEIVSYAIFGGNLLE